MHTGSVFEQERHMLAVLKPLSYGAPSGDYIYDLWHLRSVFDQSLPSFAVADLHNFSSELYIDALCVVSKVLVHDMCKHLQLIFWFRSLYFFNILDGKETSSGLNENCKYARTVPNQGVSANQNNLHGAQCVNKKCMDTTKDFRNTKAWYYTHYIH